MALRREASFGGREMSTRSVLRRELSGGSVASRRNVARDRQSMQRVIIKQGYLKKLPDSTKFGAAFKKPERRWFIFGVICNRDPYLEYFENEESIFTDTPLKMIFLDDCTTVTRNQKTSRFTNIFTLVLKKRQLSLIAQTRDSMLEWCRAIEDKLYSLGVLGCVGGDNDYLIIPPVSALHNRQSLVSVALPPSDQPEDSPSQSHRDALYEGACASEAEEQNAANMENAMLYENFSHPSDNPNSGEACVSMPEIRMTGHPTMRGSSLDNRPSRLSFLQPPESLYLAPIIPPAESPYLASIDGDTPLPSETFRNTSFTNGNHFHATSFQTTVVRPRDLNSDDEDDILVPVTDLDVRPQISSTRSGVALPSYADSLATIPGLHFLPSPMYEDTLSDSFEIYREEQRVQVDSSVAPELPPPYMFPRYLERGANVPLKVTQVQDLKSEIDNSVGVTVIIRKDQCRHSVALVDCFNKVWIAGWNQRSYSFLHAKLHIGDQLISVNGIPASSAKSGKKLIKDCANRIDAKLHLRRMPHASVFVLQRRSAEDEVGLEFLSGTSEVKYVDPMGLAAAGGLRNKISTLDGCGLCNWWITEINHRPLNLFSAHNQARDGLKALGLYISFVVQPSELILELRRKLAMMHEYKDYIVQ